MGIFPSADGIIEFWLDNCYRDSISAGPVYFDYVRLHPTDDSEAASRLFEAARWKPATSTKGSIDERTVNVTVSGRRLYMAATGPFAAGYLFPQGELAAAEHVAVRSADGKPVASQSRVLARWPDGSVKWVFIDFFHDFASSGGASYTIAYGNRIQPIPGPAGVRITTTDAGLVVDTGAIGFTVPRQRFGIIEEVRLSSGPLLQRGPIAAEIVEQSGKVWRAIDMPVVNLKVEQAGPLHAVILAETKLAESGKPSSGFAHRARIHAYANSAFVEVDYFAANVDSREGAAVEGSMSSKVPIKSMALKIAPEQAVLTAIHTRGSIESPGAVVQSAADTFVVQMPLARARSKVAARLHLAATGRPPRSLVGWHSSLCRAIPQGTALEPQRSGDRSVGRRGRQVPIGLKASVRHTTLRCIMAEIIPLPQIC